MLDKCPQCNYSLKGLPADHVCPECGLRYDEDSESYRLGGKWLYLLLPAGALLPGAFTMLDALLGPRALSGARQVMIAVLAACLVAGVFVLVVRRRRGRQTAAVVTDGLFVRMGLGAGKLVPWSELSEPQQAGKRVWVSRRGSRMSVEIHGVFTAAADAERMKRQIEERMASAAPAPGVPPEPNSD